MGGCVYFVLFIVILCDCGVVISLENKKNEYMVCYWLKYVFRNVVWLVFWCVGRRMGIDWFLEIMDYCFLLKVFDGGYNWCYYNFGGNCWFEFFKEIYCDFGSVD